MRSLGGSALGDKANRARYWVSLRVYLGADGRSDLPPFRQPGAGEVSARAVGLGVEVVLVTPALTLGAFICVRWLCRQPFSG